MADGTERRNKSILLNSHPGANSANTTTMFLLYDLGWVLKRKCKFGEFREIFKSKETVCEWC